MHLRLASAGGDSLKRAATACVLACGLTAGGCAPSELPPALLDWSVAPDPPTVGAVRFTLTFTYTSDRRPLRGARVRLEGNMRHPGMTPVEAQAREIAPGRYEAELDLNMRGDWIIGVEARLTDGEVFSEEIPLRVSAGESG